MVAVLNEIEQKAVFVLPRHSYVDPMRPVDRPLAWAGTDRVLLDDITVYGLRRFVVACKGDCPSEIAWLEQVARKAGEAEVKHWLVWKDDGYCYLWIIWKEA